ncbi:hypothetical protein C8F04DRAFT_272941 [Mycena alexandri]|uniref:Uncharacterized protein n=1 Tax=Mycena alexandri TaxID=1745969 RepID=A0AAD6X972_9AGAR|nr:hypothetical protein C8F04DRAFT_272941 [Mycena alexandri]
MGMERGWERERELAERVGGNGGARTKGREGRPKDGEGRSAGTRARVTNGWGSCADEGKGREPVPVEGRLETVRRYARGGVKAKAGMRTRKVGVIAAEKEEGGEWGWGWNGVLSARPPAPPRCARAVSAIWQRRVFLAFAPRVHHRMRCAASPSSGEGHAGRSCVRGVSGSRTRALPLVPFILVHLRPRVSSSSSTVDPARHPTPAALYIPPHPNQVRPRTRRGFRGRVCTLPARVDGAERMCGGNCEVLCVGPGRDLRALGAARARLRCRAASGPHRSRVESSPSHPSTRAVSSPAYTRRRYRVSVSPCTYVRIP